MADGVDDMSEPYYYLGGAHDGVPRIESLAFSCITAGLESFFFTKASGEIDSTDKLFTALTNGPNKAVGFIGTGNYDSVSHLRPPDVTVTLVTNSSAMEANVQQHVDKGPARSTHPSTRRSGDLQRSSLEPCPITLEHTPRPLVCHLSIGFPSVALRSS